MLQPYEVCFQCAKCLHERVHVLSVKEKTANNVQITARCTECGNLVSIPATGPMPPYYKSLGEYVRAIIKSSSGRQKLHRVD
jgi:transcription elongation factor Elf1